MKSQTQILIIKVLILATLAIVAISKSSLKIQSPLALKEFFQNRYNATNASIPFSLANYGDIPYGKTLTGKLVLPEILENCVAEDLDIQSTKTGSFIISERQDCTFTQKSLNAQLQGAKMSIIIDNVDNESPERIIMIEDGRGKQVHIPTILIGKTDGQKIVQTLNSKFEVVLTVTFQTNKTKKADMNLWLDSSNRATYIFVRKFRTYFDRISQFVNLKIRYDTYPCTYCLQKYCYGNQSYCKDNFRVWGVENLGQEIIKQQLRQQYIFELFPDKWWQYMQYFDDYCANWAQNSDCSIRAMNSIGIDWKLINQKVLDTVQNIEKNKNMKKQQYEAAIINNTLKINQDNKQTQNIRFFPSVVVNSIVYRGNMDSYDVFEILCNSIDPMPNACLEFDDNPSSSSNGSFWLWIIVGINIFFVFLLFLVIVYRRMVRRQLSRDMNSQVNELVNQYISMYENERFERKK